MVKTVLPNVGGAGSFPRWGTKIPSHMPSACPPSPLQKKEDIRRGFGWDSGFWPKYWEYGTSLLAVSKESAYNAGDPVSIPGSGRSWRREWQPTPVFLPGEVHGQRSLAGYSLWGCKESDMTKQLIHTSSIFARNIGRKQLSLKTVSEASVLKKNFFLNCRFIETGGFSVLFECFPLLAISHKSPGSRKLPFSTD